jgi:hypothetical protein
MIIKHLDLKSGDPSTAKPASDANVFGKLADRTL